MAQISGWHFLLFGLITVTGAARHKKFPPSGFQQDPGKHRHHHYDSLASHKFRRTVLPPAFDSRHAWPNCTSISLIRDQGHCGNCWAVSAASVISDRLCITSGQVDQTLISATQVTGCTDLSRTSQERCETGGDPANAYAFVASRGVCSGGMFNSTSGCIPYSVAPGQVVPQQCETHCTNGNFSKGFEQDQYTIDSYWTSYAHGVLNQSEILSHMHQMQSDIMLNGPITAAVLVYEDFQNWNSTRGPYCIPPQNTTFLGSHAVRIIGWNKTVDGITYWLLANSWSDDVGDNGIYWVQAGRNCLGIENFVSAPIINLPAACTTASFCQKPINQAVRVWPKDPSSPIFLFQDNCVLPVAINSTDGTMTPTGNADPVAKAIVGAPSGPITKWLYYNNQVILISPTNDAALDWKTVNWPKSHKTTSVGGTAGSVGIAHTFAGSTLYSYYSDALKHIYATRTNGNLSIEYDYKIGTLLTSMYGQVYSFLDLDGSKMMVIGSSLNSTLQESVVGILAYPNANVSTFTVQSPVTTIKNYLKCGLTNWF